MFSRKFRTPKIKNMRRHRNKVHGFRDDLNKHQSETEDTIKREINELKMKIKNIKEKMTKDMENLRKKESNRNIKHSGKLHQQTRTSGRQTLRTQR
jgi:hypothetical protein